MCCPVRICLPVSFLCGCLSVPHRIELGEKGLQLALEVAGSAEQVLSVGGRPVEMELAYLIERQQQSKAPVPYRASIIALIRCVLGPSASLSRAHTKHIRKLRDAPRPTSRSRHPVRARHQQSNYHG